MSCETTTISCRTTNVKLCAKKDVGSQTLPIHYLKDTPVQLDEAEITVYREEGGEELFSISATADPTRLVISPTNPTLTFNGFVAADFTDIEPTVLWQTLTVTPTGSPAFRLWEGPLELEP